MGKTENKKKMSVVKKMMIALIGGLLVGLIFMFIRSSMLDSGNEGTWVYTGVTSITGDQSNVGFVLMNQAL